MMNRQDFLRWCAAASLFPSADNGAAHSGHVLQGLPTRQVEVSGKEEAALKQEDTEANPLWIRPEQGISKEKATSKPIWGIRNGIQVGLWPASVEGGGEGGPRGLLRIGYPILEGGTKIGLVNFLAVEPIVKGQRSYSELEHSDVDKKPGRLFWSGEADTYSASSPPTSGTIGSIDGAQSLTWTVQTERFGNGAKPILHLQLRADRPGELRIALASAPDSAPMEFCIVTATMGNYMRLRQLWLQDGVVNAQTVWPDFDGREFTPDAFYSQERLIRMTTGGLLVCTTSNEENPHAVPPDPAAPAWAYRGSFPLTQYWRKSVPPPPDGSLKARVNGRRVYWASHNPIPGGLAYENFDLVEPFSEGQELIFGLTRRSPAEVARG